MTDYCEVCCPMELLPEPQRHLKERKILRGEIKISSFIYGGRVIGIESRKIKAGPKPLKYSYTRVGDVYTENTKT